jgi:restriction system protein
MELHEIESTLADIQETLEREHAVLEAKISDALSARTYDVMREISVRIETIEAFRARVVGLHTDWQTAYGKKRSSSEKRPRVVRTHEAEFYEPILLVLVQRGGRAHIRDVLVDLEAMLGRRFTEDDKLPIPSDPKQLRWENTAAWARNELRRIGHITSDSPTGIWEISTAGRDWLKREK